MKSQIPRIPTPKARSLPGTLVSNNSLMTTARLLGNRSKGAGAAPEPDSFWKPYVRKYLQRVREFKTKKHICK